MSADDSPARDASSRPELPDLDPKHSISLLYEQNGKIWEFFLDYRHKFIIRFFAVVGAGLALARWLMVPNSLELLGQDIRGTKLLFVPFVFMGFFSAIFYFVERRTSNVLVACHKVGDKLERVLSAPIATALRGDGSAGTPPGRGRLASRQEQDLWYDLDEEFQKQVGFFTGLTKTFRASPSHSIILRRIYRESAVFFLAFSLGLLWTLTLEWPWEIFVGVVAGLIAGRAVLGGHFWLRAVFALWRTLARMRFWFVLWTRRAVGQRLIVVDFSVSGDRPARWIEMHLGWRRTSNTLTVRSLARIREAIEETPQSIIFLAGRRRRFCAGIRRQALDAEITIAGDAAKLLGELHSLYTAILKHPSATVSLVAGAASGGGLGLAIVCDVVVASNDAVFKVPGCKLNPFAEILVPLLDYRYVRQFKKPRPSSWLSESKEEKKLGERLYDQQVDSRRAGKLLERAVDLLERQDNTTMQWLRPRGDDRLWSELQAALEQACSKDAADAYWHGPDDAEAVR